MESSKQSLHENLTKADNGGKSKKFKFGGIIATI